MFLYNLIFIFIFLVIFWLYFLDLWRFLWNVFPTDKLKTLKHTHSLWGECLQDMRTCACALGNTWLWPEEQRNIRITCKYCKTNHLFDTPDFTRILLLSNSRTGLNQFIRPIGLVILCNLNLKMNAFDLWPKAQLTQFLFQFWKSQNSSCLIWKEQ